MKKNVGTIDQSIRILVAVVLVVLSLTGVLSGTFEVIALVLAVVLSITATMRVCPLYFPFNLNSWEKKKK